MEVERHEEGHVGGEFLETVAVCKSSICGRDWRIEVGLRNDKRSALETDCEISGF